MIRKVESHMLRKIILVISVLLLMILLFAPLISCEQIISMETEQPDPTETNAKEQTLQETEEPITTSESEETTAEETEEIIATPTLAPTATPGQITELISDVSYSLGVGDINILGLSVEDWINLIISLLIVLIGGIFGGAILYFLLRQLAKSTPTSFDDDFLKEIRPQIVWSMWLLVLQFGTIRLIFLRAEIKQWLGILYFIGFMLVLFFILWKLIDFSEKWYTNKVAPETDDARIEKFLPLVKNKLPKQGKKSLKKSTESRFWLYRETI